MLAGYVGTASNGARESKGTGKQQDETWVEGLLRRRHVKMRQSR